MLFAVLFFTLLGTIILGSGLTADTFGGHVRRFAVGIAMIAFAITLIR